MGKWIAPDSRVAGVQIEGARTGMTQTVSRDHKGYYTTTNAGQDKALRESGFIEASALGAPVARNVGYNCANCGFGSWFKICSRCGNDCSPPAEEPLDDNIGN